LIKNSQPFGKNRQKTAGGIFLTHTVYTIYGRKDIVTCLLYNCQITHHWDIWTYIHVYVCMLGWWYTRTHV